MHVISALALFSDFKNVIAKFWTSVTCQLPICSRESEVKKTSGWKHARIGTESEQNRTLTIDDRLNVAGVGATSSERFPFIITNPHRRRVLDTSSFYTHLDVPSSVCVRRWRLWALKKQMNRSRYRLWWGRYTWAQVTMVDKMGQSVRRRRCGLTLSSL